jgi:transposase
MEIITGVERRRRWRPEEKLRILAELDEPGVKFTDVSRRHEVSRGLLWQWREAQRRGRLVEEAPVFVPLRVVSDSLLAEPGGAVAAAPSSAAGLEGDRSVEIVLPDGTVLRVAEGIVLTATEN